MQLTYHKNRLREKISGQFYLYVKVLKNRNIIYSGPSDSLAQFEKKNVASKIIEENLRPGSRVSIVSNCGGDCAITQINVFSATEKQDDVSHYGTNRHITSKFNQNFLAHIGWGLLNSTAKSDVYLKERERLKEQKDEHDPFAIVASTAIVTGLHWRIS